MAYHHRCVAFPVRFLFVFLSLFSLLLCMFVPVPDLLSVSYISLSLHHLPATLAFMCFCYKNTKSCTCHAIVSREIIANFVVYISLSLENGDGACHEMNSEHNLISVRLTAKCSDNYFPCSLSCRWRANG